MGVIGMHSGDIAGLEETYSRETLWGTYDDRELPIKDLEDSHILNLLTYLGKRVLLLESGLSSLDRTKEETLYNIKSNRLRINKRLLEVINEEIDLRGLDRDLVSGGKPLPFKKDGRWMIWKDGDRAPTPIPNSIDFIKPINED